MSVYRSPAAAPMSSSQARSSLSSTPVDDGDGLAVVPVAVELRHAHATEPRSRDGELSKSALFHSHLDQCSWMMTPRMLVPACMSP
jgi:hypothetical protein